MGDKMNLFIVCGSNNYEGINELIKGFTDKEKADKHCKDLDANTKSRYYDDGRHYDTFKVVEVEDFDIEIGGDNG